VTADIGTGTSDGGVGTGTGEGDGSGEDTGTPTTPSADNQLGLTGFGIRGMKTEQAEDIPLEDTFDFRDISLAEALRSLLTTGDNAQRTSYYGGGGVNSANSLDEIIRLLRG